MASHLCGNSEGARNVAGHFLASRAAVELRAYRSLGLGRFYNFDQRHI